MDVSTSLPRNYNYIIKFITIPETFYRKMITYFIKTFPFWTNNVFCVCRAVGMVNLKYLNYIMFGMWAK